MAQFIRNAWYVAAWSEEVQRKLLPRTILNEPVVMYRRENGEPAALLDSCPHKLAPLSLGELKGDEVECGYHGMMFDCTGKCSRIPGQPNIPPSAKVRAFPVVERYNAVWIWMGEPELADPSQIVEVPHYGEDGWGLVDGQYLHFKSNYLNITDNLVDPAHTTYVHKRTIGGASASDVSVKVEQGDSHVLAYRWIKDEPPVPLFEKMGNFKGNTDRWQYYYLHMPSVSYVDFGGIDTGVEPTEDNKDKGLRSYSFNFLTPETDSTTHYFWLHVRNYHPTNDDVDRDVEHLMTLTFNEDLDILEEIQKEQDRTGIRERVRLGIDNAPARIRKMVERRVAAEQPTESA
ncbi:MULTISPECIES: aromatic ring-hydroxylating dioxygenase subunit alpha [unclassified Halomonas]|uniref:aromatic ring-hydroxylating dioxygenase subunit alpha n=1 Tax=unclassified Halomonas TaxID=2609666 RepID=UPI001C97F37D|nr:MULTISPECIES: aromatic ring-hydroxylating dioxygenase subunit alpha [unclassified Halomonas]MBY5925816.1 aromatic ring-hydroxylating dioxygenase subunit alpha [Halomonas sp. DP4Y7-2]MBY6232858.1 aromatic ring-hydroxylating dioxygenase subunit alpha [Halomonas sp. DP4Y7-1]